MIYRFLKRGEVRKVNVQVGRDKFIKREKYCAVHGWSDLFMAGGEAAWDKRHENCNPQPAASAAAERSFEVAL